MSMNERESASDIPDFADQLEELSAQSSAGSSGLARQQFELLLQHALYISGGNYGFVLSPAGTNGYHEQHAGTTLSVESLPAVMAYPTGLHQLFRNLVNNAIKYRRPEISSTVRIRAIHSSSEPLDPASR